MAVKKVNYQVGILSGGVYVPPTLAVISESANHPFYETALSLGVRNRSAKVETEDAVTLATMAAQNCLGGQNWSEFVKSVYLGTETPTYAVGNNAAAVADFLGISGKGVRTATMEFACRAGTLALIQSIHEAALSDDLSLVLAADMAGGAAGDILSLTGGIGGVAFAVGGVGHRSDWIAEVCNVTSYTDRRSDFWRAKDEMTPRHAGAYSSQSYLETVEHSVGYFLAETGAVLSDFDHVVFHQPNLKLPLRVQKKLGLTDEQMALGLVFGEMGNVYAATALIGLQKVLESAKPGQNILVVSYGSGAGSDAIWLQTTEPIMTWQSGLRETFERQVQRRNGAVKGI